MSLIDGLNLRSMMPKKRERRTMAASVTECLRNAIQSGVLPEGVQLNQVALAEHLGVSRVPIREAMRLLEAEGWITARDHHRAVVQTVGPDRVKQIFQIRTLLEVYCLGRSMKVMTSERIKRLYAICDKMDGLDDHEAWLAANWLFHRTLLQGPDSDLALDLIEQLTSQVERYLRAGGSSPMREAKAGAEHRAILAAVNCRNTRKASELIREHIGNTGRVVLSVIEARKKPARHLSDREAVGLIETKTQIKADAARRSKPGRR